MHAINIKLPIDQAAFLLRMIAHAVDCDDVDFQIGKQLQDSVVAAIEKSPHKEKINNLAFEEKEEFYKP